MSSCNVHHIWLRAETKPNEQRRALTPDKCRELIEKGKLEGQVSTQRMM